MCPSSYYILVDDGFLYLTPTHSSFRPSFDVPGLDRIDTFALRETGQYTVCLRAGSTQPWKQAQCSIVVGESEERGVVRATTIKICSEFARHTRCCGGLLPKTKNTRVILELD